MSREEFKMFVRANPYVKEGVDSGKLSWQKAYEAYDLFGQEASEFKSLLPEIEVASTASMNQTNTASINPLLLSLASLDWNQISHTIDNLSRMVSMAKDVAGNNDSKSEKAEQVFRRYND